MDQLKTALNWLKQNYFWLVCTLLGVVVLALSSNAVSQLKKQRLSGENNIKSAVSTVKSVENTKIDIVDAAVKVHPNQTTVDGMQAEVDQALQVAAQAWKLRRSAQEGLYKWPEVLGVHKKTFEKLPWPEFIPPPNYLKSSGSKSNDTSKGLEIPGISAQVLEVYGREIRRVMPELAAIISANWKYGNVASPPTPTDAGDPGSQPASTAADGSSKPNPEQSTQAGGGVKVKKYVVQWNPADQDRWYEMVTTFRTISIEDRPTLIGAVYIQENLWLLESLFRIIKQVNGEADANDVAAIKSIDHIYFGRDAQGLSGELTQVNQRLLLEARAAKSERSLKAPTGASKPPVTPESSAENRFDPADRRFVDEKYEPIDAKTVRDAVKADKLGNSAALTVAKRIPFRIGVTMDERKIPAFLAACANSPFRFETRQVRINRHTSSLKEGPEAKSEDEAGSGRSLGTSGGGSSSTSEGSVALGASSLRSNHDVTVEFYGFIKIYNPVNHAILESKSEESLVSTNPAPEADPNAANVAAGEQPTAIPENTDDPENTATPENAGAAPTTEEEVPAPAEGEPGEDDQNSSPTLDEPPADDSAND